MHGPWGYVGYIFMGSYTDQGSIPLVVATKADITAIFEKSITDKPIVPT